MLEVDSFDTYHRVQVAGRRPSKLHGCDVNPFSFRFPSATVPGKAAKEAVIRNELKERLLTACRSTSKSGVARRDVVESAIAQLVPYAPVKETCTSPLLQRKWKLYVHPAPRCLSSIVVVTSFPQRICSLSIEPFMCSQRLEPKVSGLPRRRSISFSTMDGRPKLPKTYRELHSKTIYRSFRTGVSLLSKDP